jgi:4-amino-4-deoxy-L-arabinose transferase-like glycosyltransferase
MSKPNRWHERLGPRAAAGALWLLLAAAGAALYAWGAPANPPGFFIDESSVAYNAHAVSESGRDEHGEAWPLYFRAFGDYKNPTYVYLLAAVFRVTGPGMGAARLLSAMLGALAALLLGLLAARMTRRPEAGAVVAFSALLTPWLYESSRLVFEVAAYPAACALFLLALRRAAAKERWGVYDALALAAALALLTYTYSTGRLLAPLLAAGLALFVTRRNLARIALAWGAYAVALVPLLVYALRHPGALSGRFRLITYVTPESGFAYDVRAFALHYLGDVNPWRWLVTGERNIRDHLPDAPALLAATLLLAAFGLFIVLREHGREPWWRFQLYALAASVVPAALTVNDFPQLRLVAFPVFLHVFTVPAVARLLGGVEGRAHGGRLSKVVLYAVVALLLAQGAHFQWRFHARAPERWYVFDARFPSKVLAPALAASRGGPVYLQDPPGRSGYIQALWHGALGGAGAGRFVRLAPEESPPPGAVVVSTADDCSDCRTLARSTNYVVYATLPTELEARPAPLRAEAFRALLSSRELPATLASGRRQGFEVIVRNVGGETWPAVGDAAGRYAVSLRARWLGPDGAPAAGAGAAARIPYDMEPGDAAGVRLEVFAPDAPGEYVLELDVVQEGAAAHGARGSRALRASVKVTPPG